MMEISSMANLKMNLSVKKRELAQCKVTLAITGATQGTSREKICLELGLESLKPKR